MENEIAVLKLQLANTRDALYFVKRDHGREIAELHKQRANDEAHIVECHKTISKLLGDK